MIRISTRDFFERSSAYFIAIKDYAATNIPPLTTPVVDVTAIKDMLEECHGFECPEVRVSGKALPNPLINPTKDELLDFVGNISGIEEERLIFYFAGHGIPANSEGEPEGYFIAANSDQADHSTFVPMVDVIKALNKLPCRHVLIILDCCYAGAFRWAERFRSGAAGVPKTIYAQRFKQYANNIAWQVLTSSSYDQKALDVIPVGRREFNNNSNAPGQVPHSPFAALLLEGLSTEGKADLQYGLVPKDGLISVTELSLYINQRLTSSLFDTSVQPNRRQIAQLFPLQNHRKGEFVFFNAVMTEPDGSLLLRERTDRNPFKGLDAYEKEDGDFFYGRDRVLTDGWTENETAYSSLEKVVQENNCILIMGASGTGKSSLIKAGLIPLLEEKGGV